MPSPERGQRDNPVCLCVGFYRPGTGLSRVMETLTTQLSDRFRFHYIGIGYKGPVLSGAVTLYPCNLEGGDVYGAYQLRRMSKELQPDMVFLLNDIWMLRHYGEVCAREAESIPFVAYAAIDGRIVDPQTASGLGFLARLVAYTSFARLEVESALEHLGEADRPAVTHIGHGVDTGIFRPLSNLLEVRRHLFPQLGHPEDAFVVLNGNRPHGRKRIDLCIEAFARFARNKPDNVLLYIHNAVISSDERSRLNQWAREQGVPQRVLVSPPDAPFADDRTRNLIYNACDVGVNTAMGEGWGMVSMEHAAAGRAQFVPDFGASREIWRGIAECIPIEREYVPSFSPLGLGKISVASLASGLDAMYRDPNRRRKADRRCLEHARRSDFDWNSVSGRWERIFQTVIAEKGGRPAPYR